MSEDVKKRKRQLVFPLVLTCEQDRSNIEELARLLGAPQSEAVRRLVEVVVETRDDPATKAILERVAERVTQPWERRR
jgi:hypothetical protein